MNCAECRECLVDWGEGLLDRRMAERCQAHLKACAACGAEQAELGCLQQRLTASGTLARSSRQPLALGDEEDLAEFLAWLDALLEELGAFRAAVAATYPSPRTNSLTDRSSTI